MRTTATRRKTAKVLRLVKPATPSRSTRRLQTERELAKRENQAAAIYAATVDAINFLESHLDSFTRRGWLQAGYNVLAGAKRHLERDVYAYVTGEDISGDDEYGA